MFYKDNVSVLFFNVRSYNALYICFKIHSITPIRVKASVCPEYIVLADYWQTYQKYTYI